VAPDGSVFVSGWSKSANYPTTTGVYDPTNNGNMDAFISKLDGSLSNLLASTYLGGNGDDNLQLSALDAGGNVHVAGFTYSANFPTTPGAYDLSYNGSRDGFISKLDNDLTNLLASTYTGGSAEENPRGLALDAATNVYVAGWSDSTDYPTTPGAFDPSHNGNKDAFVSKLDNDLTSLLASTYLGGSEYDRGLILALDGSGNAYICGESYSSNYPTTFGAFATNNAGSRDTVVSKLDGALTNLLASTYIGGRYNEQGLGISLDAAGNVYVSGWSASDDYPTTPGTYDVVFNGDRDGVVSKLDKNLTNLLASTYLGGSGTDWFAHGIELDAKDNVYVAGYSDSADYPTTPLVYCPTNSGDVDVIISKLDNSLSNLLASTYLGGTSNEYATVLALDAAGNVYISGVTASENYPTSPGAYDSTLNGTGTVMISKLDADLSGLFTHLVCELTGNPRRGPAPLTAVFKGWVGGTNTTITWYGWDFDHDGLWNIQGSGLRIVTNDYSTQGYYSVSLSVSNTAGETASSIKAYYIAATPVTVYVSPSGSNSLPYANWSMAATNMKSAVDVATDGDTVLVTDAVYRIASEINLAKAVRLESVNGADATTVNAEGNGRCFYLCHTGAVVDGFTITGGDVGANAGAGVFIASNGVIRNCVVVSNTARWGAGIYCDEGGTVENCTIAGNTAAGTDPEGGGVVCDAGGTLRNCLIVGNSSSYSAGGVACWNDGPLLRNCTIVSNSAGGGGGLVLWQGGQVENCVIYFNVGIVGSNYWINVTNFSHTCTAPPVAGPGNISDDPLFVNHAGGDHHLAAGSPCIDKGTNLAAVTHDLDGVPCPLDGNNDGTNILDMGCYEFVHASADSDGDTMLDRWEVNHYLDPTNAADAIPDSDGDGPPNKDEHTADTDPHDADSYLRITGVAHTQSCTVSFICTNSRVYSLQYATNMVAGSWSPVIGETNESGDADGTMSLTDTNDAAYRAYRIGVEMP